MGQCVASIRSGKPCGAETKPGYKFCDEHKNRPNAIKEREDHALNNVVDASNVFTSEETPAFVTDSRTVGEIQKTEALPARQKNIYEKTSDVLDRALEWEENAWQRVSKLHPDEMRFLDKAGAEQLHSAVAVYERAMDRTLRAVTAIAKLNIDAQSVNVNKMVQEVVKSVVTKSLTRAGLEPQLIEQVRIYMAEEFERVAKEAG